ALRFPVVALERRARDQRLDAAALAAVASGSGGIDRVMAPLAGDVLRPGPDRAADDDAAADAGAEDHAEDELVAAAGAGDRFGEGEAVRVVLHRDAKAEPRFEVGEERLAVQALRIRVLERPARRERPRRADADPLAPGSVGA